MVQETPPVPQLRRLCWLHAAALAARSCISATATGVCLMSPVSWRLQRHGRMSLIAEWLQSGNLIMIYNVAWTKSIHADSVPDLTHSTHKLHLPFDLWDKVNI